MSSYIFLRSWKPMFWGGLSIPIIYKLATLPQARVIPWQLSAPCDCPVPSSAPSTQDSSVPTTYNTIKYCICNTQ